MLSVIIQGHSDLKIASEETPTSGGIQTLHLLIVCATNTVLTLRPTGITFFCPHDSCISQIVNRTQSFSILHNCHKAWSIRVRLSLEYSGFGSYRVIAMELGIRTGNENLSLELGKPLVWNRACIEPEGTKWKQSPSLIEPSKRLAGF